MRDSDTIESLAVGPVRDTISRCLYAKEDIKTNDKSPSWDGDIYIYSKEGKRKEDLLGIIHSQVKGKEVDTLSTGEITYQAEVSDLKNYLNNGGTLFFVVEIDPEDNRKIFYSTLLPIKLQILFDEIKEGQGTKSITLSPFPSDDKNEVATILTNFYIDSHKQTSFTDVKLPTFKDLSGNKNVERILVTTKKIGPHDNGSADALKAFVENEVCFYAQFKGSPAPVPVKESGGKMIFSGLINNPVKIDDKVFFDKYRISYSAKGLAIAFAYGVKLSWTNDTQQGKFNYTAPNSLRQRIVSLDFMAALGKSKHFDLGDTHYTMDDPDFDAAKIEQEYKMCQRTARLLETLHVKDDLDISGLKKSDSFVLSCLETAFLDNKPVSGINHTIEGPAYKDLTISNLNIRVIVVPNEKDSKLTDIEDFFNPKRHVITYQKVDDEKYYVIPGMSLLDVDAFCSLSNIDFSKTIADYKELSKANPHMLLIANETLNKMILSYDKRANERVFSAALELATWLSTQSIPYLTVNGCKLDVLQLAKRKRRLNKEELATLNEIVSQKDLDPFDRIGSLLLLGKKKEARAYYKTMNIDLQTGFNMSPMHKFWK